MAQEKASVQFVKGAAILGVAGLVSKLLGAVYRIPYQNIAGDIGLYVYMQVYPLYTTLLILATAGFPIAISKIVSERIAIGDALGARRAFRVASFSLVVLGLFFFLLLYGGAPLIARFMGDEHLTTPLRAVAWSLPLVPMAAILRGYFQGHQNMMPTGVSQVIEQLVRVIFILLAAFWAMNVYQDAYLAGTGAVFAAFPGGVAAILVLLWYWRKDKQGAQLIPEQTQRAGVGAWTNRQVLRSLLMYAVPICMGALVLPLVPLVDSITVVNMLQVSGTPEDLAKLLKGAFDRGQPLIQFGTFFATSLSLALVPAISEAVAQRQHHMIANRSEIAIRLTFLLGLPASFGLALLAEPINVMLYGDKNGTEALAVQSFTIMFATLSIASAGILQGLGRVMRPARNLFIGVMVKLILNLALVPLWGIAGAALSTVFAYLVAMGLNVLAVKKYTGAQIGLRQTVHKPFLSVIVMSVVVLLVEWGASALLGKTGMSERLYQTLVGLISVGAGAVVYLLALLKTGGLTRNDIHFLPKGKRIAALLTRFQLLPK
ncbi:MULTISPECIES: polysaccharide biosynthesis protein [Brevibacillus]|uniref:putative polysaccharide biosynthesis protein n=1 Tax=Brevibacillus TaxID=55080 RepID=UPI000271A16D|nr:MULTISPECIES: polysaccharide biosynthesis protein [Brevibacillus]EJL47922.1 membrane protein involved in the export of O-antigen and teichoic acid [Brevibacillus sp. CF112]MCG5251239.1 polysaccharide biosynthesis protein [Brevibacillus agri]MDN4093055.1 polysaccharide biosynthesis protein [Brevibacillus agri]MED1821726.1 polysaccharide biosynthesis protein [Brevibacillus agri]QHZ54198.1 polysaccharide biosynthesis protein [Brevibacillus sp. NSP2.1]